MDCDRELEIGKMSGEDRCSSETHVMQCEICVYVYLHKQNSNRNIKLKYLIKDEKRA